MKIRSKTLWAGLAVVLCLSAIIFSPVSAFWMGIGAGAGPAIDSLDDGPADESDDEPDDDLGDDPADEPDDEQDDELDDELALEQDDGREKEEKGISKRKGRDKRTNGDKRKDRDQRTGNDPTAEQAAEPTADPTAEQTTEPTADPTAEQTTEPTADPTATRTAAQTAEPTQKKTPRPTPKPTPKQTPKPTLTPTPKQNPYMALDKALDKAHLIVEARYQYLDIYQPYLALDKARNSLQSWMVGMRPDMTDDMGIIDLTKSRAAFESGDMQMIFDVLDEVRAASTQEIVINSLKHRFGQDFGPDDRDLEPESTG